MARVPGYGADCLCIGPRKNQCWRRGEPMSIFEVMSDDLRGRFVPNQWDFVGPQWESKITFHEALRTSLRTNPDWALVAYQNYEDLQRVVDEVHRVLDAILSEREGRTERAHPWSLSASRTEPELLELLAVAHDAAPTLEPVEAIKRLSVPGIPAPGKPRNVICSELANLRRATARSLGSLVAETVGEDATLTDTTVIRRLDQQMAGYMPVPRRRARRDVLLGALGNSWGRSIAGGESSTFARYVARMRLLGDLPARSDESLLTLLEAWPPNRRRTTEPD